LLSLSRSHPVVTAIPHAITINLEVGCPRPLGNLPASIFVATAVSHILTQIRHFQRTNENIDFFHTNAWRNQISCHSHLAKVSRSDERSARHRPTFHNERLAS